MDQIQIRNGQYHLGDGATGTVCWGQLELGLDKSQNPQIAFKQLLITRLIDPNQVAPPIPSMGGPVQFHDNNQQLKALGKMLRREGKIAWAVSGHPHCAKLYGVCYDPCGLVFEYCNAGTLDSWLYRFEYNKETGVKRIPGQVLKLGDKISCVTQILQGLAFLHSKGFVHRDLKPLNCLVHNYGTQEVPILCYKLTDFGSAKKIVDEITSSSGLTEGGVIRQTQGTWRWIAPERYESKTDEETKRDPRVDMYSVGCVIGEIFVTEQPFKEYERKEDLEKAFKRGEKPMPHEERKLKKISRKLAGLVEQCCKINPEERCLMKEVIEKLWPEVRTELITLEDQGLSSRQVRNEDMETKKQAVAKRELLAAIRLHAWVLQFARPEQCDDREVILSAIQEDGLTLQYASPELRNDKEIVLEAIKNNVLALQYASPELRKNQGFVLDAIKQLNDILAREDDGGRLHHESMHQKYGDVLKYTSEELRKDKGFLLTLIQRDRYGCALRYAGHEFQNNREIVLAAVRQNHWAFEFASEALRKDKKFVLATLKESGYALQYANEGLKNDKDLVVAAVQRHGLALQFASLELQNDRATVLAAVQQNGLALQFANEEFKRDKEIVLAAVQENGSALVFASKELKNDKEIVLTAVQQHASKELQNHKEIVLTAVKQYGLALASASSELRNDREVVLAAVQQDWTALQYASPELQNDKELVYAAIAQNGSALRYASKELMNDKNLVLAAVQQVGLALEYASPELRNDKDIVYTAIVQDGRALQYASPELQKDPDIVLLRTKIRR